MVSEAVPASPWTVRPVQASDRPRWEELFAGYAAFYRVEQTRQQSQIVWGWLMDPAHLVEGLIACDQHGQPVGLAHFRAFARPSSATTGGYLDDLFVDPDLRGRGVADSLLTALAGIAASRNWSVIRWITAEDNYRARGKYDQHATRTGWITYDMTPSSS